MRNSFRIICLLAVFVATSCVYDFHPDWQGVSWPQAYTGSRLGAGDTYPDYRQTIYWHPLVTLAPGQTLTIPLQIPDYKGAFVVKAEGLTTSSIPVFSSINFEIK